MRITSGTFKSRIIKAPGGIRPTLDNVRKAIFDILLDCQFLFSIDANRRWLIIFIVRPIFSIEDEVGREVHDFCIILRRHIDDVPVADNVCNLRFFRMFFAVINIWVECCEEYDLWLSFLKYFPDRVCICYIQW